jgi:hypothetical protein
MDETARSDAEMSASVERIGGRASWDVVRIAWLVRVPGSLKGRDYRSKVSDFISLYMHLMSYICV